MILASTQPGEVIVDPFFGTGTTGAVAKRLGRRWIGIERDARYVALARQRIAAVQPLPPEYLEPIAPPYPRLRVSLGMLVENNYLTAGDALYFQGNLTCIARVLANGQIRYQDGTEGSIHTVGRRLTGAPCALFRFPEPRPPLHLRRGGLGVRWKKRGKSQARPPKLRLAMYPYQLPTSPVNGGGVEAPAD